MWARVATRANDKRDAHPHSPSAVPGPVPERWRRDFLLFVDGWAKDADANTAFSQTVEPLPFHGMSVYPYPETERFPDDALHRQYREQYNTRPALKLLRRLSPTWIELGGANLPLYDVLDRYTLADLVRDPEPIRIALRGANQPA